MSIFSLTFRLVNQKCLELLKNNFNSTVVKPQTDAAVLRMHLGP